MTSTLSEGDCRSSSRKTFRPASAVTNATPFSANFASVSAVTIPSPNCVGPQGPQQSERTTTLLFHN